MRKRQDAQRGRAERPPWRGLGEYALQEADLVVSICPAVHAQTRSKPLSDYLGQDCSRPQQIAGRAGCRRLDGAGSHLGGSVKVIPVMGLVVSQHVRIGEQPQQRCSLNFGYSVPCLPEEANGAVQVADLTSEQITRP